jgi:hypothetical protein
VAADSGSQYRVLVSNAYGPTATSAAAILTIGLTAADQQIKIASIYPSGGLGGTPSATYQRDFVELVNTGATPVNLSGWSIQYASFAGTSWNPLALTGTVNPGDFYLIALGSDNGCSGNTTPCGSPLPAANVSGGINMGSTAGKLALVKTTTALDSVACPDDCRIVDKIGYGTNANCFEGTGPAPAPSDRTMALTRTPTPCTDTNDNSSDFVNAAANPHVGSASAIKADLDNDGDVDSGTPGLGNDDLDIFTACATRDQVPYNPGSLPPGCVFSPDCNGRIRPDFDKDGDIDMRDFAVFQRCYSGSGQAATPGCG